MIDLDEFQKHFPFLSIVKSTNEEFVGIVQNSDDKIISFYDFNSIRSDQEKQAFLSLGETWWFESNRLLPINIFIGDEMKHFRYCLRTLIRKDAEVAIGPCTSLNNLINRRIKRRQISLVKKTS